MVDVEWGMKQLDLVYHSEDHLKLSLAAELAQMYGDEHVRLEWKPEPGIHVDIGVRREGVTIPIELKYKTDRATVEDGVFGETFELTRQGAHDRSHYRLFRDVRRIENIVEEQGKYGYVVLLTNDSNYWTEPAGKALYDDFRVHEGEIRQGTLEWTDTRDWMVKEGVDSPLELDGEYRMEWSDCTYRDDVEVSKNPGFRYLVLRVD
ncbi:hypothetical protein [Haloarchaeobius sp. HRN-SO-5]|uniref:hypothetical protein n=1 Tax=Haloarchaeobius sp. HRN-SO-5 TaxID=3446118 RepID=UPI003EBC3470